MATKRTQLVWLFGEAASEEAAHMAARTRDRNWAAEKRAHPTPPLAVVRSASVACMLAHVRKGRTSGASLEMRERSRMSPEAEGATGLASGASRARGG